MDDKGDAIPVIFKKKMEDRGPIEINVGRRGDIIRQVSREEHISLDKIVEDSQSQFYIAGKTSKIGLMNFLKLVEKHDITEVTGLEQEQVIVSTELITHIATATVIDEDQEDMKYIDSLAVGIFTSCFILALFALLTQTLADLKSFAWLLLLLSTGFLSYYLYRGVKSGQLRKVIRICVKSLSRRS